MSNVSNGLRVRSKILFKPSNWMMVVCLNGKIEALKLPDAKLIVDGIERANN